MNNFFYLDVCSFLLISSIIISICIRKLWSGIKHIVHILNLVAVLVAVVFHMTFTIVIKIAPHTDFYQFFAFILQSAFLCAETLIFSLSTLYVFVSIGLWNSLSRNKWLLSVFILYISIPIFLVFINAFTKYMFYITEDLEFITSKIFHLIYTFNAISLIAGYMLIFLYKNTLTKMKYNIGMFFYPVTILFILVQPFYPDNQMLLFSTVITSYFISMTLQRLEFNSSMFYKTRTDFSFYSEAKKNIDLGHPCDFTFIKIVNHASIQKYLGKSNYYKFLSYFAKKIYWINKKNKLRGEVFYLEDSAFAVKTEFVSIDTLIESFSEFANELKYEIKIENFSVYTDVRICYSSFPDDIYNFEYLRYFSKQFHRIIPPSKDVIRLSDITSDIQFKLKNEIEFVIARGLKNHNFKVYYQPIYSPKEKRIVAAEALIRLTDPDFGEISPTVFIPFAESTKDIYKITEFVFSEVNNFIESNEFKKLNLECIEINLSTSQCIDEGLSDKIINCFSNYSNTMDKLRLEITEAAVDANSEIVLENIIKLQAVGVKISLDNYGTGYSNIKQLISLPLEIVKLDKSFICEYQNPQIKIIVDETIKMLKELGKKVLVEGIENQETAEIFTDCGCDLLQGYYYSKPLPKEDFIALF